MSEPSTQRQPSADPDAGDVAAPLDLLLTDAALGPTRRFFPGVSGLRFTRALAAQPRILAWTQNPFLRRTVQAYLATSSAVAGLVSDVPLSERDTERVRFVTDNLIDALAPSNNPLLSPVGWKA